MRLQIFIKASQDLFAAVDQNGLNAQAMEDSSEFHGDIAATHNAYAARQFFEMESFVGGDCQFIPRQMTRYKGGGTRGNQNNFGGNFPAGGEANRVAINKFGAFHNKLAPCPLEIADVSLVEPVNFLVLVFNQGWPVERHFFAGPAKANGILKFFGKFRGVNQQFFRHAAPDNASAADAVFLCHDNLRAVLCCNARGANTA
jgi:hypothetical protein